jgi:hypothetical protein
MRSWSRSAASVLASVDLHDWIADSPGDYVERAMRFAQLRTSLRSRMLESSVMDAPGSPGKSRTRAGACGGTGARKMDEEHAEMVRFD